MQICAQLARRDKTVSPASPLTSINFLVAPFYFFNLTLFQKKIFFKSLVVVAAIAMLAQVKLRKQKSF